MIVKRTSLPTYVQAYSITSKMFQHLVHSTNLDRNYDLQILAIPQQYLTLNGKMNRRKLTKANDLVTEIKRK